MSIKELSPTITGLRTLPPWALPPAPVAVTPGAILAGSGENVRLGGIVAPQACKRFGEPESGESKGPRRGPGL